MRAQVLKENQKLRDQLIVEMTEIINEKELDVDMPAILHAVDVHQQPHEDNQTTNITNNSNDIDDIKNIRIWDTTFGG